MNNTPHEVDGTSELAAEMRRFWHLVMHASETHGAAPRQPFWVLGALSDRPLTGIVDRLEEQGFVRRERSTEDRRVVVVELTPEGAARITEAKTAFRLGLERLLEPLTAEERAELLRLHRKLTGAVSSAAGDDLPRCS